MTIYLKYCLFIVLLLSGKEKRRDIEVGILWDKDDRLSKIFLNSFKNIKLGDNKPYSGRLKNDTLFKHAQKMVYHIF